MVEEERSLAATATIKPRDDDDDVVDANGVHFRARIVWWAIALGYTIIFFNSLLLNVIAPI